MGKRPLTLPRRNTVAAGAFSVAAAVVVSAAVIYPGFKTADVDLLDGGVWVTSQSRNALAHLNYQSKVLDGAVVPASADFDVLQAQDRVFMDDRSGSVVNAVNTAAVKMTTDVKLPPGAQVSFGDDRLAVTDPATGRIWAMPSAAYNGFNEATTEPTLRTSAGVVATVGRNGTVYAADTKKGQLTTVAVAADGTSGPAGTAPLAKLEAAAQPQLAAVGEQPVVFDASSGTLYLPGGKQVQVPDGAGAKLQQSGTESSFVAVATSRGLVEQPLDGSGARTVPLDGSGPPTAPVQVNGCVYGAWAGVNQYLRQCQNQADNRRAAIPGAAQKGSYEFRVNRDVVVLNDLISGEVWLVKENMQLVNNWDEVIPPKQTSDQQDKESADDSQRTSLPDRTKPNSPPEAKPDSFGVRAGKTTLLPVLDNDTDPDGDILTVDAPQPPRIGTLEGVYAGTGFQLTVPPGKTGSESFKYKAEDGRGGTASTEVNVRIIPPDQNAAPRLKPNRSTKLVLQSGKELSQNILQDWLDPDGDDLFLVSASTADARDQVKTRPDGLLTFLDGGGAPGRKTVNVKVSDGTATSEGKVSIDVRAPGALSPIANADHVTAVAGQSTVVAPLKNDTDPQGGALRLAHVVPDAQSTAVIGADQQTFSFKSSVPGPHYVTYLVTNGPASDQQLVRVDVVAGNSGGAPVAVRDVALLPAGGNVLVDVLGNDSDPSGGVLVVQSVSADASLPLSVSVLDHSVVRITDLRAQGQLSLRYTISNGRESASGEISVLVVPAPEKLQAPQAKPDEATVRAGDVATVPVLANDTDPNGGKLTLDRVLPQSPAAADGRLFGAGDTLRFIAGPVAKTVYAIYNVFNSSGQKDSGQLTIHILPRDDERNSRPQPANLTGRVVAGMSVRIPVPLDGIDPDGDSVQLVGIDKAPGIGTAVARDGYLEYFAGGKAAGTDTFTYRVRDRIGAENTGTVIVGVAPAQPNNQKPVAVDDDVAVRPGRLLAVDALANDSDPDGDPIHLIANAFEAKADLKVSATEQGKVLLTAPAAAGTQSVRYQIRDDKGASASAVVRVQVSPEAALKAPVAKDDRVTAAEALGKAMVDVPVLANDSDPDGVGEGLKIGIPDGNRNARPGGSGNVLVTLTDQEQVIPYTVTDVDGLTSTAIIWVPGKSQQYPTLAKTDPVEVMAGKDVTMDLKDYVRVRDGRTARISVADRIRVLGASPENVIAGNGTALHYAALMDYVGPGSITFEVTDGTGPDDPNGLKSTLTVMTKVLPDPNANHRPTFQGTSLEVPKGEPVTLDLGTLAKDVDNGDHDKLSFDLDGALPSGFTASVDGKLLTVSAGSATALGASGPIPLRVTDGRTEPVRAAVTVTLIASNRPKPVANDDAVANANAGRSETVDVLANDFNPFPESALKIVAAQVETGSAAGAPVFSGGSVTVKPAEGYKGVLVVRYTVQDKTGEPTRQSDGRLRLTVRGKPDAPSAPAASDVRDRTAVLRWSPPSDNGAAISKYTVRAAGFSQDCTATTCTLTGLTNNVPYTFTVTATNEVGESAPSAASNEVRPDVKPSPPGAPTVKAGDKTMAVNWAAATSSGSPVKSYTLEISPPPENGVVSQSGITGLSYTWPGLTNGVKYRVRVQAVNSAPTPSDWSAYSAPDYPAGAPSRPAPPTTAVTASVGTQNQLRVSWTEPFINGDPVRKYYVVMNGGGAAPQTQVVGGDQLSADFTAANSETSYTFTVQAENKGGKSPVSGPSAPRRATGKLAAVGSVTAVPANTGAAGGQLKVDFKELTAAQRNGSTASEVSYRYNASPSGKSGPVSPGQTIAGFANGTQQAITVVADSTVAPSSDASAPARATPYGDPGTPSASGQDGAQNQKSLTLSWSSPSPSTHDPATTQIRIDGGTWESVAPSGSRTLNTGGFNETHRISVRVLNSVNTAGPIASASAKSGPQKTSWNTRLHSGMDRSCTDLPGATSWDETRHTCDGQTGYNRPWMGPSDSFTIMCWKWHGTADSRHNGQPYPWYYIMRGSPNATRWIDSGHTTLGPPPGSGVPECNFPTGATP